MRLEYGLSLEDRVLSMYGNEGRVGKTLAKVEAADDSFRMSAFGETI